MNIFITGSTGFLGKRFLHTIIQEADTTVYVAIRPKSGGGLKSKLKSLGVADFFNVIPLEWDLTETTPNLKSLPAEIDEFWHIAGLTDFHESKREQLFSVNVDGTNNALQLARKMRSKCFYYISTAYVAGIHAGPVMEDSLLPSPRFRNPYEESKYAAETAVRESGLPFIIVRPSIIVGDSRTGEVEADKMVYGVAKAYHLINQLVEREYRDLGEIPADLKYFVKGDPDVGKNLICVDDVVHFMGEVRRKGETGKTYHCVNPDIVPIGRLHEVTSDLLGVDFFQMQVDFTASKDRKQKIIDRGVAHYEDYMLNHDPIFDLSNSAAVSSRLPVSMDEPMVRFLFTAYLQKLSSKKDKKNSLTTLDLERLPDVKKYGSFTLAYETMSRQLEAFRLPGTPGYIAYTVVDNTAIMVADPLSPSFSTHTSEISAKTPALLTAFVDWCRSRNLNFCALQTGAGTAGLLHNMGLSITKFGIETHLPLAAIDSAYSGKDYQDVRKNRNIARRVGLVVREGKLDQNNLQTITNISDKWLNRKKNRSELSILIRKVSLAAEPDVRYFFAELNGRILGYIFFNPIYKDNRVIGYYTNTERYDLPENQLPGRFNIMTHITYAAIEKFRAEQVQFISLGLSPLYDVSNSPYQDNPELTGLFEQMFAENELYAFQGIAFHKMKHPARKEIPVYFAVTRDTLSEDILNIFKGVGLFGNTP